jgi:hypothetical protein
MLLMRLLPFGQDGLQVWGSWTTGTGNQKQRSREIATLRQPEIVLHQRTDSDNTTQLEGLEHVQ